MTIGRLQSIDFTNTRLANLVGKLETEDLNGYRVPELSA